MFPDVIVLVPNKELCDQVREGIEGVRERQGWDDGRR